MKEPCDILVLYGDPAARDHAVRFCDSLMEKFWSEHEFNLEWCPLNGLASKREAKESAELASKARLVVFSLDPVGKLPAEFREWVESWVPSRCDCEGSLVGLLDDAGARGTYAYLRDVAHRANMDYLTHVPDAITHEDSLESCSQRATKQTSILQRILENENRLPTGESVLNL